MMRIIAIICFSTSRMQSILCVVNRLSVLWGLPPFSWKWPSGPLWSLCSFCWPKRDEAVAALCKMSLSPFMTRHLPWCHIFLLLGEVRPPLKLNLNPDTYCSACKSDDCPNKEKSLRELLGSLNLYTSVSLQWANQISNLRLHSQFGLEFHLDENTKEEFLRTLKLLFKSMSDLKCAVNSSDLSIDIQ